ncbi:MAG: RNA-processing protein [Candidatus Diapherotrites archaeon]|nr:RNA-processing protein [Candidatus Diapherotrites archaeon]
MMEEIRIPMRRLGALIGPKGSIKREIEKLGTVTLEIDSDDGTVLIEDMASSDAEQVLTAIKVVKAIARGFSPEKAFKLFEDNLISFDVINLNEFDLKTGKAMQVKRGRVIGAEGKARYEIEKSSGAMISVQGKTIAFIGTLEQIDLAKRAVEMLLEGAKHSTVFGFMHNKPRTEKFEL